MPPCGVQQVSLARFRRKRAYLGFGKLVVLCCFESQFTDAIKLELCVSTRWRPAAEPETQKRTNAVDKARMISITHQAENWDRAIYCLSTSSVKSTKPSEDIISSSSQNRERQRNEHSITLLIVAISISITSISIAVQSNCAEELSRAS